MIFQPNRLQQKNFAQLKNTSEYAKMVSGFLLLLSVSANIYANPANEEIKIRITDENQKPIF